LAAVSVWLGAATDISQEWLWVAIGAGSLVAALGLLRA
jgi:hypothetical protein